MCCFSRAVQSVSNTAIFARDFDNARQLLVYSMQVRAKEALAMILPLPVPAGSKESAVTFLDLHAYENFFVDLKSGFPEPIPQGAPRRAGVARSRGISDALPVVTVGSFEASFVPTLADFARLDPRFQLPPGVWSRLPQYKSYGFAVFKLKNPGQPLHPMAFSFPKATPGKLFFPTVHIHDGQVKPTAHFDHQLYAQVGTAYSRLTDWRESEQVASSFTDISRCQGILDPSAHVYLKQMNGMLKNEDVVV